MLLNDFHLTPVHAYRSAIISRVRERRNYRPYLWQISFCKCGSGIYLDDDGNEYEVHPGDIFLRYPKETRMCYPTSQRHWIVNYANFDGKSIRDGLLELLGFTPKSRIIHIPNQYQPIIERLFYDAAVEYAEDTEADNVIMHTILYKILCEISVIKSKATSSLEYSLELSSVLLYIDQNIEKNISVHDILKNCNITRALLYSQFKEQFGITPNEYITNKRIENATHLLLTKPDMSLKEIAIASGISSSGYLINLFKKKYGLTPIEFKNSDTYSQPDTVSYAPDKSILPVYLVNAFSLTSDLTDAQTRIPYMLMYCTEGMGLFTDSDDNTHTISPGSICYVSPSAKYTFHPIGSTFKGILLTFSGTHLKKLMNYLGYDKTNVLKSGGNINLDYLYAGKRLLILKEAL